MFKLLTILRDEKGSSMLLMTVALSTLMLIIFALHLDIDQVLLTKVTISSISDMAAREASNMINTEVSQTTGASNLDPARVRARVDEVFDRHKGLLSKPIKDIQVIITNNTEITVLAAIDIPLSNYIGTVTIRGRGKAKIQGL